MTREEAIEALREMREMMLKSENWENLKRLIKAVTMGAFAIKALEQTRWIPVSERLPEKDGVYLVTTTGTNNDIIDIAYYTDDIWNKASRIKAWMPLPEPYKVESEDKE